ncbi:MAG: hypothetical protein GY866_05630 [Proteobacteria bacterium]|nr:hypothetical protein [Pseudomonadota bacterium]
MDNQQFAFVQMGKKQFALKAGDRIGNLQILKIFDDFLVYEINNQVFETSIEKVPVNERSKIRPDQTADDAEKLDDSNP